MKILVITHEYPPVGGGGANACFYLVKELARFGHTITILTAAYKTEAAMEEYGNIKIIRVKSSRKYKEKSSFFEMLTFLCSALLKADRLTREERYDVCQVFFGIPSGPVALYLKRRRHIPYVVRFGGGDIPGTQKRFSAIYWVLSPMIRKIWKNADFLVANSKGLKERAEQFEGSYPIQVICNGVDIEYYKPCNTKTTAGEDAFYILFVSRLLERKGLQDFIVKLPEIIQNSQIKIQLTVVGEGPYRETLEGLVRSRHLEQVVIFEGHKEKKELLQYYQKADLFILPSRWEGMPNVVLEAMAAGLPVIMTPCEGSKELIDGNGAVVSIENFTNKVLEAANNPERLAAWCECSRKRAVDLFQWSTVAQEYEKIYKQCALRE